MKKLATPASFKPGQSGNPNGRPKKEHSITQTIRNMMDVRPAIKKELALKILELAMTGDITAMKTIWGYLDGMPKQDVSLEGEISHIYISRKEELSDGRSDD